MVGTVKTGNAEGALYGAIVKITLTQAGASVKNSLNTSDAIVRNMMILIQEKLCDGTIVISESGLIQTS